MIVSVTKVQHNWHVTSSFHAVTVAVHRCSTFLSGRAYVLRKKEMCVALWYLPGQGCDVYSRHVTPIDASGLADDAAAAFPFPSARVTDDVNGPHILKLGTAWPNLLLCPEFSEKTD